MLMLYIHKYACEFLLNNVWITFWFLVAILLSLVAGRKKIWMYRHAFIFLTGKVDTFIMEIWVWIKSILFFVFLISTKRLSVYGAKILQSITIIMSIIYSVLSYRQNYSFIYWHPPLYIKIVKDACACVVWDTLNHCGAMYILCNI